MMRAPAWHCKIEDDLSSYDRISKIVGREKQKKNENDPWKSNMLCLQIKRKMKKRKDLC
jgi:hypothetical protein